MDDLLQKRIKQRDRWTCRLCGSKFVRLQLVKYEDPPEDDSYITVCDECFHQRILHMSTEEAQKLCRSAQKRTKVVLIGDAHGRFDRLDEILTAEAPFDFFISVGDVGSLLDAGSVYNINIVDKWGNKGYFVKGNHDDAEFFSRLELMQEIGGLRVAGLNGIIRHNTFIRDTKNISFREVLYLTHQKDVDILVTHQAPTGVFTGKGEPVLEEVLNYLVPKIYIFGHVHSYKLKFHLNTFVMSLPLVTKGHAVAYFQGRDLRNLEVIFRKGKKVIRV